MNGSDAPFPSRADAAINAGGTPTLQERLDDATDTYAMLRREEEERHARQMRLYGEYEEEYKAKLRRWHENESEDGE